VSDASVVYLEQASLLIIPCSQSKWPGSKPTASTSILPFLAVERSRALLAARAAVRQKASVDDTLMSAHLRYRGSFYDGAADAIAVALRAGHRVVTVSGAYGVLVAEEAIGSYKRRLSLADWPKGLLESCLIDYANSQGVQSIFAFMSRSGAYYKLIERTPWHRNGLKATLISPEPVPGAYRKAPRAAGEAMRALVEGRLTRSWVSSDGLRLDFRSLGLEPG